MKAFKASACIAAAMLGISLAAQCAPSGDVVPWSLLAKVKTGEKDGKVLVRFAPQVKALNQKRVRLQGYMQPLDASLVQRQFLLTIVPMTCPEDMPGGPVSVIYVRVAQPVEFVMGPVVVEGTLDVGRNPETGM